jgi:hypothetical protein
MCEDGKEFTFGKKRWALKWETLKAELEKCELLCLNCHDERHFNVINGELKRTTQAERISKEVLLKYKNKSSCEYCGYSKCASILHFHHTDEKSKSINSIVQKHYAAVKNLSEEDLNELDKCVVICPNCHNEVHSDKEFYESNKKEILEKSNTEIQIVEKITDEEIINFRNSGLTIAQISSLKNCAKSTVFQRMERLGLTNKSSSL